MCACKRHSLGVYSHFDIDVYGVVESWCCSIHKCTSYTHSHSYSHISPPVYTINFACESTTCVNVCVCCTYQTNLQRRVVFSIFRKHRVSEWEWKTLCQLYGYGVPAIVQHFAVWHTFYHSFVRSFVRFDRSNGIKSRKFPMRVLKCKEFSIRFNIGIQSKYSENMPKVLTFILWPYLHRRRRRRARIKEIEHDTIEAKKRRWRRVRERERQKEYWIKWAHSTFHSSTLIACWCCCCCYDSFTFFLSLLRCCYLNSKRYEIIGFFLKIWIAFLCISDR